MPMWAWYIHTHTHRQAIMNTRRALLLSGTESVLNLRGAGLEPTDRSVCKTDTHTRTHSDAQPMSGELKKKNKNFNSFFYQAERVLFLFSPLLVLFCHSHSPAACVYSYLPDPTQHCNRIHTHTLSLRSFLAVGAVLASLFRSPVTAPASHCLSNLQNNCFS